MSKVLQRIQEAAAERAAKEAAQEAAQVALNDALEKEADGDLQTLFGEMADELRVDIVERKVYIDQGQLTSVVWWVASEALQLAPTRIEWTPKHRVRGKENRIDIAIQDGGRGQTWIDVADEQFDEVILVAMHLAYGPWKAAQEKLAAKQIEEAERAVMLRKSQLCHPNNWIASHSDEYVMGRYQELVDMGEEALAEEKLALWRANVAALEQEAAAEERERLAQRVWRLPRIRKLIQLAQHYREREAAYGEMRRQWAERWTRGLWKPWLLWRVRYVPVYGLSYRDDSAEEGPGPETMMCLEGPDAIVTALRAFPTATTHRVQTDGSIVVMEIGSFVDAEPVPQETMTIGEELAYHRRYRAGDVVVNVPATEGRGPEAAPTLPPFAELLLEVDEELAGIVRRMALDDFDAVELADLSPEEAEERLGRYYFD